MGLDQESGINERFMTDPSLAEVVDQIFLKMHEAFKKNSKLLDEYQDAQRPSLFHHRSSGKSISLYHANVASGDSAALTFFVDLQSPKGIPPSAKLTLKNYGRRVKWATLDKKRIEVLVKSLTKYNSKLECLATTTEQHAMRRRWRTHFLAPSQPGDLVHVQDAAKIIGHHDLFVQASSKALIREIDQKENLHANHDSTKLKTVVDSVVDMTNSLHHWRLDHDRLDYEGVMMMADHARTLAMYTFHTGKQDPVLVDWSRCRDDSWRLQNIEAFQFRVSNLARVLNRELLPRGFRILQCIGYINASNATMIGYVFRPPPEALPGKEPVSLHQILRAVTNASDIPELGVRFALARAIVTTVFEFHNIGWLHKNIQPENILFWPSKHIGGELDLRKPYLVGFDLSRSNQPGEVSEKPISSETDDLYRHPAYKGPEATGFRPAYDYYSLCIVLFEIAMWRLVSKISTKGGNERRKASLEDPDYVHKTVMNGGQDLGRYIGARYRDAVLSTVSGEFDQIWDKSNEETRDLALQHAFQKRVVDAVAFCQA